MECTAFNLGYAVRNINVGDGCISLESLFKNVCYSESLTFKFNFCGNLYTAVFTVIAIHSNVLAP